MAQKFTAEVCGQINGAPVSVLGSGIFNHDDGCVDGTYQYRELPDRVHPYLFNCIKVTGYPSVCMAPHSMPNPFRAGSYSYTRVITFGPHGRLEYTATCEDGGTALASQFVVEGNIDVPALLDPAPIVESWLPAGKKRIDGRFSIIWPTTTGEFIVGEARTEYTLPVGQPPLSGIFQRYIRIRNSGMLPRLGLYQKSFLFDHADHLLAPRQA